MVLQHSDRKRAEMAGIVADLRKLQARHEKDEAKFIESCHKRLVKNDAYAPSEVTEIMRTLNDDPDGLKEIYQPMPPILDEEGEETGEFEAEDPEDEPEEEAK